MALLPNFPYKSVVLSEPLNATQEAAVTAANATLTGSTFAVATKKLSIAGQTDIDAYEIGGYVKRIIFDPRDNLESVTPITSEVIQEFKGPALIMVVAQINLDDRSDEEGPYALIMENPDGIRVLRVEMAVSKRVYALPCIIANPQQQNQEDTTALERINVEFHNAGLRKPKWEVIP